jgi:hypothetical protein
MKRFVKNKLVWLTVGGAIGLVMVSYANFWYGWHWPNLQKKLFFLKTLEMGAWISGALASGSMESPNFLIFLVSLFMTYVIILGGLATFFCFVYKKITKRGYS